MAIPRAVLVQGKKSCETQNGVSGKGSQLNVQRREARLEFAFLLTVVDPGCRLAIGQPLLPEEKASSGQSLLQEKLLAGRQERQGQRGHGALSSRHPSHVVDVAMRQEW